MKIVEVESWNSTDKKTETLKVAAAPVLRVYTDTDQVAVRCPWCPETHLHGAVNGDGDGHRVSHCIERTSEDAARSSGVVDAGGYEVLGSADAPRVLRRSR